VNLIVRPLRWQQPPLQVALPGLDRLSCRPGGGLMNVRMLDIVDGAASPAAAPAAAGSLP
jgi:hypothetical protein